MKKILIIEDDTSIAEIVSDFLEINGYQVMHKADGLDGLNEALTGKYDLILLDLLLPRMDGFEICKQVREQLAIPILMATAKIEDVDKIRGLGLGADDYISKPFSLPELVARVKANLAQYERIQSFGTNPVKSTQEKEVQLGNIRLNVQARRVYVEETEIDCKAREFDLLAFLMKNPDTVFSKEQLYEQIWGMDSFGDVRTIAVHINRLREKIEKDPQNPVHIQTVWGVGYRFRV